MESIGDLEGKDFSDTWRRKSLRLLLLRFTKVIFYKFKVSDNSMDDHQQSLSPVSLVHTKMVNIIKKTRVSEVDTKKKKRVSVKKLQGSWAVAFTFLDFLLYVVCFFLSSVASIIFIIILFFF
ncbi:uncharacterized protein [Nicotiana sylvestris]|uniref:Uncharacterized protein LOC104250043 isoform X2 n=1 Tax=Nicotiana sylvestris TaxID=4096 RepID=A0A1U7YSF6_NICSY|nr:PREDICTED: uncharacterized protein LOC104250043 isoform X2 [Nicotiana sylvestris]